MNRTEELYYTQGSCNDVLAAFSREANSITCKGHYDVSLSFYYASLYHYRHVVSSRTDSLLPSDIRSSFVQR
jgi:hypothetical protein